MDTQAKPPAYFFIGFVAVAKKGYVQTDACWFVGNFQDMIAKQSYHYTWFYFKKKKKSPMAFLAAPGPLHQGVCTDKAKIANVSVSKWVCQFKFINLL